MDDGIRELISFQIDNIGLRKKIVQRNKNIWIILLEPVGENWTKKAIDY